MEIRLKRLKVACWVERWKERLCSRAPGLQIHSLPPTLHCTCYSFLAFSYVNFHIALYCTFMVLSALSIPQNLCSVFGEKAYKVKPLQSHKLFAVPVFCLAEVCVMRCCTCMTVSELMCTDEG